MSGQKKLPKKTRFQTIKKGFGIFLRFFVAFVVYSYLYCKKQRTLIFKEGNKMRTQIILLSLVAVCLTLNSPVLATVRLVPSPMVRGPLRAGEFSHLRHGSALTNTFCGVLLRERIHYGHSKNISNCHYCLCNGFSYQCGFKFNGQRP